MAVTDRRVQKMNEILTSIKFIKMYAWVKAFAQDIHSTHSLGPLTCVACCHGNCKVTQSVLFF